MPRSHVTLVHFRIFHHCAVFISQAHISLSARETSSFQIDCVSAAVVARSCSSSTFMLHSYLLVCYAEWWLNNMHYPRHQPQGSIFPVLLVWPGSPWSDGVISCLSRRLGAQFSQPSDWYAWGEKDRLGNRWNGPMKTRECAGSIYVLMGHLISVFPISALMIC